MKLRKCPFCGSVDIKLRENFGLYWVDCKSCCAEGSLRDTDLEAIKIWNTVSDMVDMVQTTLISALEQVYKETDKWT